MRNFIGEQWSESYLHTLLGRECRRSARDKGISQDGVCRSVNFDVTSPSKVLGGSDGTKKVMGYMNILQKPRTAAKLGSRQLHLPAEAMQTSKAISLQEG